MDLDCKAEREPVLLDIYRKNKTILEQAIRIKRTIQRVHESIDTDAYGITKECGQAERPSPSGTEPPIKLRFDTPQICGEIEETLNTCEKSLAELLHKIIE